MHECRHQLRPSLRCGRRGPRLVLPTRSEASGVRSSIPLSCALPRGGPPATPLGEEGRRCAPRAVVRRARGEGRRNPRHGGRRIKDTVNCRWRAERLCGDGVTAFSHRQMVTTLRVITSDGHTPERHNTLTPSGVRNERSRRKGEGRWLQTHDALYAAAAAALLAAAAALFLARAVRVVRFVVDGADGQDGLGDARPQVGYRRGAGRNA